MVLTLFKHWPSFPYSVKITPSKYKLKNFRHAYLTYSQYKNLAPVLKLHQSIHPLTNLLSNI